LAVVLFHAGVPGLTGGFVGVDVFFVISGYLIGAHVYADVRRRRFRIRDFYRKRAKRILPALLVVVAFCEIAGLLILSPEELLMLSRYCIATLASAANVLAWLKSGYFAAGAEQNPLLMAWSLGVEEQFYVLFPLSMLALGPLRRRTLFLAVLGAAVVSLLLSVWMTQRYASAAFYLLPTRAWELAVGVLLAVYEKGRDPAGLYGRQRFANIAAVAGVVTIGAAVLLFNAQTAFPGWAAVLPVCGSALLLSAPGSWVNRWVLSSGPFVFIGQVSYSFYLWHWPLLSFAHIISDHPVSTRAGCFIAAASLACAWLSYRFVEQPFRRSETPSVPLLLRYAILCAILAIPAVVFHSTEGLPRRFASVEDVDRAAASISRGCAGGTEPDLSSTCVNRQDPRPAVALIGDSHAAALAPGVAKVANEHGYKLYEMIRYSCPPLVGVVRVENAVAESRDCIAYNARVMRMIQSDPSVRIVVITAYWAGPEVDHVAYVTAAQIGTTPNEDVSRENLAHGLAATVSELRAAGKKVVLAQDVPVFAFDPVRRMICDLIPVRSYIDRHVFRVGGGRAAAPLSDTAEVPQRDASEIVQRVAAEQSVPLFDPRTNLCSKEACRFETAGEPLYGDKQHVTERGALRAVAGLQLP